MVTRSKLLAHYGNVVWLNANMRTDASTQRKHPTQALMGAFYVIDQIFGKFFC